MSEVFMRVLVCGARAWTNKKKLWDCLDYKHQAEPFTELIEGDARGADRMAGEWAEARGIKLVKVPAEWDVYGRSAGFRRNIKMLDMEPDLVIAFVKGESRGTMHTVGEAVDRGMPGYILKD